MRCSRDGNRRPDPIMGFDVKPGESITASRKLVWGGRVVVGNLIIVAGIATRCGSALQHICHGADIIRTARGGACVEASWVPGCAGTNTLIVDSNVEWGASADGPSNSQLRPMRLGERNRRCEQNQYQNDRQRSSWHQKSFHGRLSLFFGQGAKICRHGALPPGNFVWTRKHKDS